MYTVKQSKGIFIVLETRKDIPSEADKPGTNCVGSLSLGKEVFWPMTHSYVAE